jgi:hypothetical protein
MLAVVQIPIWGTERKERETPQLLWQQQLALSCL